MFTPTMHATYAQPTRTCARVPFRVRKIHPPARMASTPSATWTVPIISCLQRTVILDRGANGRTPASGVLPEQCEHRASNRLVAGEHGGDFGDRDPLDLLQIAFIRPSGGASRGGVFGQSRAEEVRAARDVAPAPGKGVVEYQLAG